MNILLTGATGFLGSQVLPRLLAAGNHVYAPTRRQIAVDHPNLVPIDSTKVDVLTAAALPWEQVDAVLHLAASGVKSSDRRWPETLAFNVVDTQRLLNAIGRYATRTPAFVMTRTFYEHLTEQSPALLENPYVATKRAAGDLVQLWADTYSGPVALATVFQVYGPGDDPANVLSYAARQIARGEPAMFGSGSGLRDWIYIDDAARAIVATLNATIAERSSVIRHYDIGTGELRSIREMILEIAGIAGSSLNLLEFDPAGDRPDGEIEMCARAFVPSWEPAVYSIDGLSKLYELQK